MQITVKDFKQVLRDVSVGLNPSEIVEQSNCFIFQDSQIMTFNDEMMAVCSFNTGGEIEGAVLATELNSILDKIPESTEITVGTPEEGKELQISYKGKKNSVKSGISFFAEITLPLDEIQIEDLKWKKLPSGFQHGVGIIADNASRDRNSGLLQCVNVNKKKKVMEATDNYNIVRYQLDKPVENMSLYRLSAKKLSNFPLQKYAKKAPWIFFKTEGGLILGAKTFGDEADYPDLSKFFESFEGEEIQLPSGVSEAVAKARVFLERSDTDELIEVSCKKKKLTVQARGPSGWMEEVIKAPRTNDFSGMYINASQLLYLVEKAQKFEIGKSLARIETENMTHISALR